jgi:hypothetical protein
MYQVPVNRPPRDSRRRLPLIGALQGALYGFIRAMTTGAVLGGLGVVISVVAYVIDSPRSAAPLLIFIGGFFFWMLGVMLFGGVPASIIGLLTGLAIGIQLRRLEACDDALAGRIGTRTSQAGVALIILAGWLIMPDKGNMLAQLIAALLVLALPGLIYIVTAGRFATLLNQRYPVAGDQWPMVGGRCR